MGWNPDCEGALEANGDNVALFDNRTQARNAIRISKAREKLRRAQGEHPNEDFVELAKHLRVLPVVKADA